MGILQKISDGNMIQGRHSLRMYLILEFNLFNATTRYKRHQNKVKVKGLGRNLSHKRVLCEESSVPMIAILLAPRWVGR